MDFSERMEILDKKIENYAETRRNNLNDIKNGLTQIIDENENLKRKNEQLEKENEELKKENETMREQLINCEQRQLLKIIEELTAKNNKLEYELHIDPTRNYLAHNRNERIVKLLSEAFKYINDPSLISPHGLFK